MVGVKGLEPSTSRSQTARASQLRHTPIGVYTEVLYQKVRTLTSVSAELVFSQVLYLVTSTCQG